MEKQFLEFLGNFLIGVAKGQRQMDDISKWMGQDFKGMTRDATSGMGQAFGRGYDETIALFKKIYGIDTAAEKPGQEGRALEKAREEFMNSLASFQALFDVVPKSQHVDLVAKHEALKEQVEEKDETIRHLRMLLKEKQAQEGNVAKTVQELMQKQSEQVMDLMKTFSPFGKGGGDKKG